MPLNAEVLSRLAALGISTEADLRFWEDTQRKYGDEDVWRMLRLAEGMAADYRFWFPQLKAFERECRKRCPVPAVEDMSIKEREQHRVLFLRMRKYMESASRNIATGRPNRAVIVVTTRSGLAAAYEIFRDTGVVLLEESERRQWFSDVYPRKPGAFGWYSLAIWLLYEGLGLARMRHREEQIKSRYPIPEGYMYWEIYQDASYGPLASSGVCDLWQWDGARASFLGESYSFIS